MSAVSQETLDTVERFARAQVHELRANAFKGDHWHDVSVEDLLYEVVYHALKLTLAVDQGKDTAVLEFAADVSNCAMMVADKCNRVTLDLLSDRPSFLGYSGREAIRELKVEARQFLAGTVMRWGGPDGALSFTNWGEPLTEEEAAEHLEEALDVDDSGAAPRFELVPGCRATFRPTAAKPVVGHTHVPPVETAPSWLQPLLPESLRSASASTKTLYGHGRS